MEAFQHEIGSNQDIQPLNQYTEVTTSLDKCQEKDESISMHSDDEKVCPISSSQEVNQDHDGAVNREKKIPVNQKPIRIAKNRPCK